MVCVYEEKRKKKNVFIIDIKGVHFMLICHKLESFGKRGSKLRKRLQNIGLKATLWNVFG